MEQKERQALNANADIEAALIEKARHGDRNAYGELVRLQHSGVVNVVYRLCGDAQLAEDAAQDAFIRAWLNLASFRRGDSLRNWLYRIAVNAALDALRRETKRADADIETLSMSDPQDDPETALVRKERAVAVQQAILSLTESCRAALVLREYGELSYEEIAAALDVPLGTVMSRLNYARNQLKQALRESLIETEFDHG